VAVAENTARREFIAFVEVSGPRLQSALMAALGPDAGDDAASEALMYGWRNWERAGAMENPVGYLYRVGLNHGLRAAKPKAPAPMPRDFVVDHFPDVEPGLPAALASLSERQRVATLLVHAEHWTFTEVAELLGIDPGSVKKHADRGLAKLRKALEVVIDA
jgi:DNA-directed RNA polymerase specialized sigma24 family protein